MIVEDPDGSAPAGAYVSVPMRGSLLRAIRRRRRLAAVLRYPHLFEQLLLREEAARVGDQLPDQPPLERTEMHLIVEAPRPAGGEIDGEVLGPHDGPVAGRIPAAQRRSDAGEEL